MKVGRLKALKKSTNDRWTIFIACKLGDGTPAANFRSNGPYSPPLKKKSY